MDVYVHARAGEDNVSIAKLLKVDYNTFLVFLKDEGVAYALQKGREKSVTSFEDYVYESLSPEMRELWEKIEVFDGHRDGRELIEKLLENQGKTVRQNLWLHAMIFTRFNASEACRLVNVSYPTIREWKLKDPAFKQLLDEVQWHMKNFFEGSLTQQVAAGNILAVLFANRTVNKDRGYDERVKLEVSGRIDHAHYHYVAVDRLKLKMETRVELLEAMRELVVEERGREQQMNGRALQAPIDVQV